MEQKINILLSRTDAIGDVVLSLPLAGILKQMYPNCTIYFLGQTYTKEIIDTYKTIDKFINWNEIKNHPLNWQLNFFKNLDISIAIHIYPKFYISALLKLAGIPIRIGTSRRWYHQLFCNKKVSFSRRSSDLHEAQLNLKLLIPLGINKSFALDEITELNKIAPAPISDELTSFLDKNRFNLILHPKSRGHGKEWSIENFSKLIEILDPNKYNIIITGTQQEKKEIQHDILNKYPHVVDLVGKMSLDELLSFISKADGLVASGTGPLHLAAAAGIHAVGLFPPVRPVFSRRWAPIGKYAKAFEAKKTCINCRKNRKCECLRLLSPSLIASYLDQQSKPYHEKKTKPEWISNVKKGVFLEDFIKDRSNSLYNSEVIPKEEHFCLLVSKNHTQTDIIVNKLRNFIDIKSTILIETSGNSFFEQSNDNKFQLILKKWSFINPFKVYSLLKIFKKYHVNTILVDNTNDLKIAFICAKLLGIKNIHYHQQDAISINYAFMVSYIFSKMVKRIIIQSEKDKYPNLMINYRFFSKEKIKVLDYINGPIVN